MSYLQLRNPYLHCAAIAYATLATTGSLSHAAVLFTYDFDPDGTSSSVNSPATGLTLSNWTFSSSGSITTPGVSGNAAYLIDSLNGAFNSSRYMTFNLTVGSGYSLDINSVTLSDMKVGGAANGTWELRWDNEGTAYSTVKASGTGQAAFASETDTISGATGLTAGTYTFRLYAYGLQNSNSDFAVDNFSFDGTVNQNNDSTLHFGATPSPLNNTTSATTATQNFGRVMQGSSTSTNLTVNRSGTLGTTYSRALAGDATSSTAATGSVSGASLSLNAGIDTSTTGSKSGTITVDNTASNSFAAGQGSQDGNDVATVTGTVVANRVVSATSINFTPVIVNGSISATSTLSTTGSDDTRTRVSVALTGTDGNLSATGGSGTAYDDALDTGSRNISGSFSTAGAKSGSLTLTTTGEGLSGETPINVAVAYSGNVLDHSNASFTTPSDTNSININFGTVNYGDSVSPISVAIRNLVATAGFTAGLDLDSIGESGDTGNAVSTTIPLSFTNLAAGSANTYSVSLDSTVLGAHTVTYTLTLSDENLPGATGGQTLTINVTGNVVPEPAMFGLAGIPALALLRRRRSA